MSAGANDRNSIEKAAVTFPRLVFLVPIVMTAMVVVLSPNFRWSSSGERAAPFGGDFLQDWVGGGAVRSKDRKRLYDLEFIQSYQHDRSKIGFEWPERDYFPMVYPPFFYYLVSPFSLMSYRAAVFVWAVFSTLWLIATGVLVFRFFPEGRQVFKIWFVGASIFGPWLACLNMGQKSSLFLFLFTGTFLLLHQRREFWAGVLFGLVAIKPQLGIVVGGAMLLKRRWSFVAGAAISISLLVGLSWVREPSLWRDYGEVVAHMGDYIQTGGYRLTDSHSLWAAVQLAIPGLNPSLVKWIALLLAVGILVLLIRAMRGPFDVSSGRFQIQFSVWLLATVLLSPHFYSYDLTILLLPLILILVNFKSRPSSAHKRWVMGLAFGLYAFAGSFSMFAAMIRWQPSLLVLGGLIWLLATDVGRPIRFSNPAVAPSKT